MSEEPERDDLSPEQPERREVKYDTSGVRNSYARSGYVSDMEERLAMNERIYVLEKQVEWMVWLVPVLVVATYLLVRHVLGIEERLDKIELPH